MRSSAVTVITVIIFATSAAGQVCGDLDTNGSVSTSDALRLLRFAVGQPVSLQCPACTTTTTLPAGSLHGLSAGAFHTCGINDEGRVVCWGRSFHGQTAAPEGTFEQVSAGGYHTCGLRTDGSIDCWGGNNGSGETDFGQATPPDGIFAMVSSGDLHSCGLRPSGSVECWGRNKYGETTVPPNLVATSVGAGDTHSCAIKAEDGTVVCWGLQYTSNPKTLPDAAGVGFTHLSVGHVRGCASKGQLSTLWCWNHGNKNSYQYDAAQNFSSGDWHHCFVRTENSTIVCNTLPDDPTINSGQSDAPPGEFREVTAGGRHTCAVAKAGTMMCWGDNTYGQLLVPN